MELKLIREKPPRHLISFRREAQRILCGGKVGGGKRGEGGKGGRGKKVEGGRGDLIHAFRLSLQPRQGEMSQV